METDGFLCDVLFLRAEKGGKAGWRFGVRQLLLSDLLVDDSPPIPLLGRCAGEEEVITLPHLF